MRRLCHYIVKKSGLNRPSKWNRELCQELIALSGGNPGAVENFYVEKVFQMMLLTGILVVLTIAFWVVSGKESGNLQTQTLERPGYGMGNKEEELTAQIEGEEPANRVMVDVQDRKYTQQEVDAFLEAGILELEKQYLGKNQTADEVRWDLVFPETLLDGKVSVSWMTIPYGVIDTDGKILDVEDENGRVVEIHATLRCQGKELTYETAVCVYPPLLTEEESFWKQVKQMVRLADERDASLEVLHLPETVDGKKLIWMRDKGQFIPVILLLTLVLPLALYVHKDQKIHELAKSRKQQLLLDYPDVIWKMSMLLGAGMTIHGAFTRIAQDYEKNRKKDGQHGSVRYVYEEMCYTCREMQSGISEGKAYENFGRRCELPNYIKLGSLLSQNLRKGSKGLRDMLEKEAASSMEERKNLAKKLGEQAATKLLFPMILMFGIVLIVLIVPAFLAM